MKRPSFQFYPSDWLRDTSLRTCSIGARGLWIDMICYMHEGTPYGHLKVKDKVILPENLARMVGETLETVDGWLKELFDAGVFQLAEDGSIFSKRMVKDEALRNARAEGGKKGGNPLLMAQKDNLEVNQKVIQIPTPSSSSSSSFKEVPTVLVDKPSASRLPVSPNQEIVDLYHKYLPMCPRVEILSDGRKRSIGSRWRDIVSEKEISSQPDPKKAALDWFEWFFDYVSKSRFLTGRAKDWKADLDFLMTASKFTKVVEGHYHKDKP